MYNENITNQAQFKEPEHISEAKKFAYQMSERLDAKQSFECMNAIKSVLVEKYQTLMDKAQKDLEFNKMELEIILSNKF